MASLCAQMILNSIQPRASVELCKKKGIPDEVVRRMQRLEGAHNNGNEGFPLWAISIVSIIPPPALLNLKVIALQVTANLCGVAPQTINGAALYLWVPLMLDPCRYGTN